MIIREPKNISDILHKELDPSFSRVTVQVMQGQNLAMGTVYGRRAVSCPEVGTAKAGNTGNGTVELVSPGPAVSLGSYRLVCTKAEADGGVFAVFTPEGVRLADAAEGASYEQPHISFVVNDGTTDFAVGDEFTIAVAEGDGKVGILAPEALDGQQVACGVMITGCDATVASVRGIGIERDAIFDLDGLVWPEGITAPEKAQALKQLADRRILVRKGV